MPTKNPIKTQVTSDDAEHPTADSDHRRISSLDDGLSAPGRRKWTYATVIAACLFMAAMVWVAMRFFVDFEEVNDTPSNTVESFLTALLDEQDSAAAAEWTCEQKSTRDFEDAVAQLGVLAANEELQWGNVTETSRSLGEATVEAEFSISGTQSATLEFDLVAEDSEPQWMICGLTEN
ncbi:hypothetical protein [Haloglycomyces albus]|uniref:hypothetical protein n=1 Tax=Haloglycomyces albus TaxID=526067 RepID=UPI00046CFAE9|nr:hypothetical protein [Haloglycomyces albus]